VDEDYSGFKNGYKYIFSLPRGRTLVLLIAAANLLCLAVSLPLGAATSLARAAAAATLLTLACKLMEPQIVTWKRAAGFYTLFSLAAVPALAITGEAYYAVLLEALLCHLFLAAVANLLRAFTPLLAYLVLTYAAATHLYTKSLLMIAVYLVVSLVILAVIDRRVRRSVGVGGLRFLRGFLRYILSGEREELEECFMQISKERTLALHLLRLFDSEGQELGRILVSEIHPGPMRDLGSSSLPSRVISSCTPTIFLKAPSTHSENLANSAEVEEIARKVCSLACRTQHSGRARVGAGSTGKFYVVTFDAGNVALAFIDPLVPMEDLPREVFEALQKTGVVAIDTHSMIDKGYLSLEDAEIYAQELSSLYEIVQEALRKNP